MSSDFPAFLQACQQRVQQTLESVLPKTDEPASRLKHAMRYSALNGGKRVRATLVYAAAEAVSGKSPPETDSAACAVELVHAYSLVHDDLPAMDNDDLRRGQPTCHIAFDEATAILAGDALQTLAFEHLATSDLSAEIRCQLVLMLAQASGATGMVAGQDMDLAAENSRISLAELESLHRHKTGALITASVQMGAIVASASEEQIQALTRYAEAIGLAFQVQDDILDIEGSTEELGKTQGADIALNKSTYPSLLGIEQARQRSLDLRDDAIKSLSIFGPPADHLRALAHYIINRKK
ncbi:MAG TPA: (2E,6E)-farnesyl diphosphate synthase [Pseudomonadales bacterium]|nr:(2E,6E)-farnesyl diphosphate synthase [Pseudomonadales bacterium]